jgi:hypothetical protein
VRKFLFNCFAVFFFIAAFEAETMQPCFYKPHNDYFGERCPIKLYHCHQYERLLDEVNGTMYWAETGIFYPRKTIKKRRVYP